MFDLIVFCSGQRKAVKDFPNNRIWIEVEQRYCDIWKCLSEQKGIWYTLSIDSEEIGGTKLCEHIDSENNFDTLGIAKEVAEGLTPYKIRADYADEFKDIIQTLLDSSPLGMVCVLARYQSLDAEVVLGTYSKEKFFDLMQAKKIYANVCYIITKFPNAL